MKGRDEHGYPLEGEDVVPEHPKRSTHEQETIPRLVTLLQEANRRLDNNIEAFSNLQSKLRSLTQKYNQLNQHYMALKREYECDLCQKKRETTPNGGCVELCHDCGVGRQTIESLKLNLAKEEERSRYWHECYETSLRERYETDIPLK